MENPATQRWDARSLLPQFAAVVENSPNFIAIWDLALRASYINVAGRRLIGIGEAADSAGFDLPACVPPELREKIRNEIVPAALYEGRWSGEFALYHLTTSAKIPMLCDLFRIDDPETGRAARLATVARDITRMKQIEEAAWQGQERFRSAFANAPIGMTLAEPSGRFIRANRAFCKIIGYSEEELRGLDFYGITHPEDVPKKRELIGRLLAGEAPAFVYEKRYVTKRGTVVWVQNSVSLVRDTQGSPACVICLAEDITTRRQAQEDLRESRSRLRIALEVAGLGDWDLDLRTHEAVCSDLYYRILGYASPLTGWRYERFLDHVLAEDRDRVHQKFVQALTGGDACEFECRIKRADGAIRWTWVRGRIYRDSAGGALRVLGTIRDITAERAVQREREELLVREQAARAEAEAANRAKDQFLGVVSHELRSPLNSILGWASIIRSGKVDQDTILHAAETIERGVRAQAQIIDDILDVSRITTGKLRIDVRPVEISSVVEQVVETMRPTADARGITLTAEPCAEACMVMGDPDRLQQVLWNLISNALKFTPEGGDVAVRLTRLNFRTQIVVADTGEGISPEFLPFVFDRFRQADTTSARRFGGLGLGLAIVRHLVELHGGEVRADSAGAGKGATFTVTLPLIAGSKPTTGPLGLASRFEPPELDQTSHQLDGVQILAVDDEDEARILLEMALKQWGADVRTAASSAEALEIIRHWRPQALVSDIGLPGEDGYGLIARIRHLPPESGGTMPAVAVSGYTSERDRSRALEAGYQAHLPKPLVVDDLLKALLELVKPQAG